MQHELQGIGLVGPERVHTQPLPNLVGELGRAARAPGRPRRFEPGMDQVVDVDRTTGRIAGGLDQLRADPLDDRVEGCGGVRHGIGGGSGAGTGTVRTTLLSVQSRLQRFTTAAPERSRWTSDSTSDMSTTARFSPLSGRSTSATAPSLRERLVQLIDDGRVHLVIDLTPVDFLDSTGLGVLVGTLKRIRQADGELRLVVPQERIKKLFEITGLTKVFDIVDQVDGATEL